MSEYVAICRNICIYVALVRVPAGERNFVM
jgi:hypothetical protein